MQSLLGDVRIISVRDDIIHSKPAIAEQYRTSTSIQLPVNKSSSL